MVAADDPSPSAPVAPGKMNMNAALRLSKVAAVKVLTQADIDSHKYTIFDVVLPMPGFAVVYPTGKLCETYRETIKADKLDPDDLFRKQKCVASLGSLSNVAHTSPSPGSILSFVLSRSPPSLPALTPSRRAARTARSCTSLPTSPTAS